MSLPFTYRDPAYVQAAGVLRAARLEWMAACADPKANVAAIDSRRRAYESALQAVRDHEDRIVWERAAMGSAKRLGRV